MKTFTLNITVPSFNDVKGFVTTCAARVHPTQAGRDARWLASKSPEFQQTLTARFMELYDIPPEGRALATPTRLRKLFESDPILDA